MIRKYFLDSTGGLDEDSYYLVFEADGNMVVRVVRDFEQPYKKDRVSIVEPKDFDRISVNGQPLRKLVVAKLEEVLAPPPPSKSFFQPQ